MIYTLERAIKMAMNQETVNKEGDKIACIKITQSDISINTELDYEIETKSGITGIAIRPKGKNILLYEDKFNIPKDNIDTYLRSRTRVKPLPSVTLDKTGRPINNIRVIYKLMETHELYLIVRDLYFPDTEEGKKVIDEMGLFEDAARIDGRLYIVDYQAADREDLIFSLGIKSGFTKLKYDTSFKIVYGEREDGTIERLEELPAVFEGGNKVFNLGELAYFPKSSVPTELNFIDKSDTYTEKFKSYKLMNFDKAPRGYKLSEFSKMTGLTFVNNLLPDEVVDYLFPHPEEFFFPKSIACMQLENIADSNPQYPIEVFDECNSSVLLNKTVHQHIEEQIYSMLKKDHDVYIVPDIAMLDDRFIDKSFNKHVIVLTKSNSYEELHRELRCLTDSTFRERVIESLDRFINVGTSPDKITTINPVEEGIKDLLTNYGVNADKELRTILFSTEDKSGGESKIRTKAKVNLSSGLVAKIPVEKRKDAKVMSKKIASKNSQETVILTAPKDSGSFLINNFISRSNITHMILKENSYPLMETDSDESRVVESKGKVDKDMIEQVISLITKKDLLKSLNLFKITNIKPIRYTNSVGEIITQQVKIVISKDDEGLILMKLIKNDIGE